MRVFLALIAVCVNLRWVLSCDILSTVWHCCFCCCCRPWCCQYCCCCCCACCYCFCCVLKVHCLRIKHMKMLRICRTALSFAAAIKLPCSAVSATPHAWYCCCCMFVYYANFKFGFGFVVVVVKFQRRPHKFCARLVLLFFFFVGQRGIWNSVSMH